MDLHTPTRIAIIVVFSLPFASDSRAQSKSTVIPSLALSMVYDDNLFSTPQSQGDAMMRLRPGLEISHESPTTNFLTVLSIDMQRALNYSTLNTFDARRHAFLDTTVRATPRVSLGLAGRYDRTDTPGELNIETGILGDRRRALRWQLTPAFHYRLTPRSTFTSSYDTTQEAVVSTVEGAMHVARLGFMRLASERTTTNVGYIGRRFVNGPEFRDSHALVVGWTRELAPAVSLTLQGGPRLDWDKSVSPELLGSLYRNGGDVRYAFDFWRGQTIVLGILGPVDVNSTTARISWPLVRHVEVGTHFGYFDTTTIERAKARVVRGSIVGAWSPGGVYTVAISYGADFQKGDIRSVRLAEKQVFRHVLLVQLTVAPRLSRTTQPTGPADPRARPKGGVR